MILDICLLITGLALIIFGADFLVDGASGIARKSGVSEFVIGLTIVGFGTSLPELVVSLTGAIQGNADVSLGNVIGSNIFNTFLILGVTAAIAPVRVSSLNRKRDLPIMVLVTFLFLFLCRFGREISRFDGILMLALFAGYLFFCFKSDSSVAEDEGQQKNIGTAISVLMVVCGLAALIAGGRIFVNHSVSLARSIGVSDKVIAITLLASGTSLPELVTCIVASSKHRNQLALGNIIGSNIFNILLILGVSSILTPLSAVSVSTTDIVALAVSAVSIWLFTCTGRPDRIDRWEGALLVVLFGVYYLLLFSGSAL